MNKIFKIYLICFSAFIILLSLSGCNSSNDSQNSKNLARKISTEISYVDSELISIVNELNNINYAKYKVEVQEVENQSTDAQVTQSQGGSGKQASQEKNTKESGQEDGEGSGNSSQQGDSEGSSKESSEGISKSTQKDNTGSDSSSQIFSMESSDILGNQADIDWEKLKSKVESLYTSWTTVARDLEKVGVATEQLNAFANDMDKLSIAVKTQNKNDTIDSIINMYEYLPKFAEKYDDNREKDVLESKYNLLVCYKYADVEDWEQLKNSVGSLKMSFSNISSQKSEFKGKELNIENAAIILNEMADSYEIRDRDIFFIKYKNLMQELNVILAI